MELTVKALQDLMKRIDYYNIQQSQIFYLNENTWNSFSPNRQREIKELIGQYYGKLFILKNTTLEDGKIYYIPVKEDWYMGGVKKVPPKVIKKQWNPNKRGR